MASNLFVKRLHALCVLALFLGGGFMADRTTNAEDLVDGPRQGAWKQVDRALAEGKPKTAIEALTGVEQAAIADKAWPEAARAIATRVLAKTGDRPGDDPERLVLLTKEIEQAPAEVRSVLQVVQANWTWSYFMNNRWRFVQRTSGGATTHDLAAIATWDLPKVVGEIRGRFAEVIAQKETLQKMPIGQWNAIIKAGTMSDAYRPTVWDVVVRDALEFASSGERGLVDPEDTFEIEASGPALGTLTDFLAWRPDEDKSITDTLSPLLQATILYRSLLEFHQKDPDITALASADLDRILWASAAAVGAELADRKKTALAAFIERFGNHETASLARFHLASLSRQDDSDSDSIAVARAIAAEGLAAHPQSVGGRQCKNLIAEIDSKSLSVQTERTWAEPWPSIRFSYKNISKVHVRIVKADWLARLQAGKPHWAWLDDADRAKLLAEKPVQTFSVDLPATPDYAERTHAIPVPKNLEPGNYWVIASHAANFGDKDNVVQAAMAWVSRLALVSHASGMLAGESLAGHVVDIASGEPIAGANVKAFVREERGNPPRFVQKATATTDRDGRYQLPAEQGRETVLLVAAKFDGREHTIGSESLHVWPQNTAAAFSAIILLTDRGMHRPGQIVHYKGILCRVDTHSNAYAAQANKAVSVVLRDANGREVARMPHTTNAFGSFHGNVPIATGALPGQWSLTAEGEGTLGSVAVRVEEYKRPKYQVKLAALAKEIVLDGEVSLTGTATTYTGLPVANAKVRFRVERQVRFPDWCRCFFPGLPIGGAAAQIARGTAVSDANGAFTITFVAKPDRSVPRESMPVFTYRVTADATDAGGETRSDEKRISAGYTSIEATLAADPWQAVAAGEVATPVAITLSTASLDGEPRAATGKLQVFKLVQPAAVGQGEFFGPRPTPRLRPLREPARRGLGARPVRAVAVLAPSADDVETWATGETLFSEKISSDPVTGKVVATPTLPAGIYRAVFEIPGVGAGAGVKAVRTVEVIDPTADRYAVKRAFVLTAKTLTAQPGSDFQAIVGTGYDRGRVFVEILQAGKILSRFWTEPGRTQWPVTVKVGDEHRGGFTVNAWIVRDGHLRSATLPIDVPWTNKSLAVTWERFTRRVEPAAKEIWRAKVMSVADPLAGPAVPAVAEMVATLYDQSLDALANHVWPNGLQQLFRHETSGVSILFSNSGMVFNAIGGNWIIPQDSVAITYRELREPFGPPTHGAMRGFGGGRDDMPMALAAMSDGAPGEARMLRKAGVAENDKRERREGLTSDGDEQQAAGKQQGSGNPPPPPAVQAASPPPPRKNMAETAFFLPSLVSDQAGIVTLEFTLPDTLTTWQFKGLAHDALLRSGTLSDTCVAAKDLMVEPMVPRFLREGDVVEIPVKVSNRSTGRLTGTVKFSLADARTNDPRDGAIQTAREQPFDLAAGASQPVVFTVKVADGTEVLRYLATGTAGKASDGEEALLPVLSRRVLVSESVPVTIRGPGKQAVVLQRLAQSAGGSIQNQSLVIQAASNPAWYAVLALPSIMEQSDESTETLFTRLYANSLARHIATRDPKIAQIFAQWKGTDALESPLERNTDLIKTLLAETPWVRDAVNEGEARARIALLFDATRAENEMQAAFARLQNLRNGDGGWPWFPGGSTCDCVTLSIVAGFGRLRASGVAIDMQPALATLGWLDGRLIEEMRLAQRQKEERVSPIGVLALYARSFLAADMPAAGEAAVAVKWGLDVGRKTWMKLDARRSQGHLAIALFRAGDRETALSIVESLRQRAVGSEEKPDAEKNKQQDNWQGMWWRDPHPSWWNWASAPIETQAVMIEVFDEVAGDAQSVESLKAWLLSQKRTSRWRGDRATADAVYALLGRGNDLLAAQELVTIDIGGQRVQAGKVEAGTGFFETRLVRGEIGAQMADIVLTKPDAGIAWGGVHWQYLDDIANVPAVGREELAIEKKLFVKRFTKAGAVLEPAREGGATKVGVGDELVVRLVVTSDRDYEFLELTDHRPSLTEPVDVLSGWRWADGAGWYVAVRDASTQLFFERLPRGTHVFEYSLRAAHRGSASTGFATIQSRYAPEFSAHSDSIPVEVQ